MATNDLKKKTFFDILVLVVILSAEIIIYSLSLIASVFLIIGTTKVNLSKR